MALDLGLTASKSNPRCAGSDRPFLYPPHILSRQLKEWDQINPGRASGFDHLIFRGNPRSLDDQRYLFRGRTPEQIRSFIKFTRGD